MRTPLRVAVFWAIAVVPAALAIGQPPAPPADKAPAPAKAGADYPQTPGHHNLFVPAQVGQTKLDFAYAVYLPKDYAKDPKSRWPMVVFLNGAGECGNNHEALYAHGPAAELKRIKELADWAPFIVLSPQCPSGMRWSDTPGLADVVLQTVELAKKRWRVDADKVYLTGLSMGGAGTWAVAEQSRKVFAAIAPVSANEVSADKAAKVLKGTTVWIISGAADGGYTEGSRKMRAVLEKAGVDVVHTEVPGGDHGVWTRYYPTKGFYEFLLMHTRGKAPPKNRPVPEELLRIAYTAPQSTDVKLADAFRKFQQYWTLLNCGPGDEVGLKEELDGKKGVFVTAPLDAQSPCLLITSLSIPKGKKTTLKITVGYGEKGKWLLVVRGNEQDLKTLAVCRESDADKDGWIEVVVDLTRFAGQDVRMQLLDKASDPNRPALARWAGIDMGVVDKP